MKLAKAKQLYRARCYNASLLQYKHLQGTLMLSITFYPPDRRKRDLDNMLASIKAGLDGLSDAIGIDDSEFAITIRKGDAIKNGAINIEVSEYEFDRTPPARIEATQTKEKQTKS